MRGHPGMNRKVRLWQSRKKVEELTYKEASQELERIIRIP